MQAKVEAAPDDAVLLQEMHLRGTRDAKQQQHGMIIAGNIKSLHSNIE